MSFNRSSLAHPGPTILIVGLTALTLTLAACGSDDGADCTDGMRGLSLSTGERANVELSDGTCESCRCIAAGNLQCTPVACAGQGGAGGGGGEGPGTSDPIGESHESGPSGDPSDSNESGAGEGSGNTENGPATEPGPGPRSTDSIQMPRCTCTEMDTPNADQFADAVGLCGPTRQSASLVGDSRAFAVREDYFGILSPGGGCIGVMSTGLANAQRTTGGFFADGGVGSGTAFSEVPSPNPNPEGGPDVYDLAQLVVELTPPPNARGFRFNFMFLSAEWPQYLCQQFNDTYLTIVETGGIEDGQPTNISFDLQGNTISVNAAFLELPRNWTTPLQNTPFGQQAENPIPLPIPIPIPGADPGQCPSSAFTGSGCTLPSYCNDPNENLNYVGSGTGWLFSQGPILQGEDTVRIVFSIHDEGDAVLDSKVLISDFQWLNFAPPILSDKL